MDLRIQGGYAGGFGMQSLNPMERSKPIVNPGASTQVQAGKKVSPAQCQTCATRMYKDGSDENDVSFKAPGHIDPGASAAVVRGHEQEHVVNAYEKAAENNGKVLQASVSLNTAICPECGRSYVAGGTTTTMIKYSGEESSPYRANQKAFDGANGAIGGNLDLAV
ncbi:MAG: hypothetical protein IJR00_06920 [Lachnospiraceae bacterium]|nr:hypothetical protein [Lachnospiraceae bacterium]